MVRMLVPMPSCRAVSLAISSWSPVTIFTCITYTGDILSLPEYPEAGAAWLAAPALQYMGLKHAL